MSTRTSIELDDETCRLVEVRLPASGAPGSADARVTAFALNLPGANEPQALEAALTHLRRARGLSRDASVTLWGTRAIHRVLRLRDVTAPQLKSLALAECADDVATLAAQGNHAWVTVIPGRSFDVDGSSRRHVTLVALPGGEARRRIAPILAAGFRVTRLVTPALALAAVARRFDDGASGAVCGVAIGRHACCIAVAGAGTVLVGHELGWGHADMDGKVLEHRVRDEIRRWVRFLADRGPERVQTVALCGDMPGLRVLTAPLAAAFRVPVQTLDSLAGIDAGGIPEPSDMFRSEVSSLRLSIAAAGSEPVNLMPERARRTAIPVVALAAAAIAGVAVFGSWPSSRTQSDDTPLPVSSREADTPVVVPVSPPEAAAQVAVSAPSSATLVSSAAPVARTEIRAESTVVAPDAGPAMPLEEIKVTSILYSSERQLAIVNGRLVRVGDGVGKSLVYQIQPRAVVMQSSDGRRWTVLLRPPDTP